MIRFFTTPALILAAAMTLSACATPFDVSRNAPLETMRPVIEVPMHDWIAWTLFNWARWGSCSVGVQLCCGLKPTDG